MDQIGEIIINTFNQLIISIFATFRQIIEFILNLVPDLPPMEFDFAQGFRDFLQIPFTSGAVDFIGWIFGGWHVLGFVLFASFSVFIFRVGFDFLMFVSSKIRIGVKK